MGQGGVLVGFLSMKGYDISANTMYENWIINYPKHHDRKGTLKSQRTDGKYNSIVRIFKNMKSHLVDENLINEDNVSSHHIQCLIYNVPSIMFQSNYQYTVSNILGYLNDQDISIFKCQNEITSLFGNSPDQWPILNARKFINEATKLWNNW